jgi:hypothetical protein
MIDPSALQSGLAGVPARNYLVEAEVVGAVKPMDAFPHFGRQNKLHRLSYTAIKAQSRLSQVKDRGLGKAAS